MFFCDYSIIYCEYSNMEITWTNFSHLLCQCPPSHWMYFLAVKDWFWDHLSSKEHNTAQLSLILQNECYPNSPAGRGPPGSDFTPSTSIQHLIVGFYPHGNLPLTIAGVWEEVRCLEACFLLLFSQVCWPLKRFVCGWFTCQGPSQTCVPQHPVEQAS